LLVGQRIWQVNGSDFWLQGEMLARRMFGAKAEAAVWRLV
jgi:hypothetical protein